MEGEGGRDGGRKEGVSEERGSEGWREKEGGTEGGRRE